MACEHPNEEWTVFTTTDTTWIRAMLVFCFFINPNGQIEGEVNELPINDEGHVIGDPIFLDNVRGHQDPTKQDPSVFVMTLNFRWGGSRVIIAGIRFTSGTPNTFEGRFSAFGSAGLAVAAGALTSPTTTVTPEAPGDGDTGTATGTQT